MSLILIFFSTLKSNYPFFISGHWFWLSIARFQSCLQHLLAKPVLPGTGNHSRTSVLRSHWYVVFGLCRGRIIFGLAFIPRQFWIRSNSLYFSNSRYSIFCFLSIVFSQTYQKTAIKKLINMKECCSISNLLSSFWRCFVYLHLKW